MNATSEDVKTILTQESGSEFTFGVNLFIGKEPASPSDVATIFDTSGSGSELHLSDDQGYESTAIQIRVRSIKYLDAYNVGERIKNKLHGLNHVTIGTTLYTVISCANGPFLLDWDENSRARFVLNFDLQRRTI